MNKVIDTQNNRRSIQIILGGAAFLPPFIGSSLNLAIPSIGISFSASAITLSWVVTSYLLATVALLVPFGSIADMIGRKKIFTFGLIFFICSAFLGALSWSIESLLVFRVLQGLGCAMLFGTSPAILTSAFSPQERGKVLGTNVAMVYLGLTLGPFLGGFLNHHFGWRSIFLFCGSIALIVLALSWLKLSSVEESEKSTASFDILGALLYTAGMSLLLYGFSSLANFTLAWLIAISGLVILGLFIRHELRASNPVFPLALFKNNQVFAFANLAALINYSATFVPGFLMSIYLQTILGYSSQIAGYILLSQAAVMVILSPIAGKWSDQVNAATVAIIGMSIAALGVFIFTFISLATPIWVIVLNLAILGTGIAIFASPNTNMVMSSVEKRYLGTASSTLGTMRLAGQTIGMALITLMLGYYIGHIELTAADPKVLLNGIKTAFGLFTVISIGAILALWKAKTASKNFITK